MRGPLTRAHLDVNHGDVDAAFDESENRREICRAKRTVTDFLLVGKVIGADRSPRAGLQVQAFDHHGLLGSDTLVGAAQTDSGGRFSIPFDDSAFRGLWEKIAGIPHIYVTLGDSAGHALLTSPTVPTQWQLEFHIKLGGGAPVPGAPDLYSDGLRRETGELRDIGSGIQMERTLSQVHLTNGRLEEAVRREETQFLEGAEARTDQVNHLFALLDGVWSEYIEGTIFRTIGYDGPQTARNPWTVNDALVIVWPRREKFRWA